VHRFNGICRSSVSSWSKLGNGDFYVKQGKADFNTNMCIALNITRKTKDGYYSSEHLIFVLYPNKEYFHNDKVA
jgi:hypothetical protein